MATGIAFKANADLQAFRARIKSIGEKAKEERKQAVRDVAGQAKAELKNYNRQMRKINKQDALPPGNPANIPASKETKIDQTGINSANSVSSFKVIVAAQWVKVRDGRGRQQAAYLAIQSAGDSSTLQRTQMAIRGRGWKNTKLVDIATFQNLNAWAHRPEKGYQIDRHQVYLSDTRVLDKIVMQPVLKAIEPFARIRFSDVLRRVFEP